MLLTCKASLNFMLWIYQGYCMADEEAFTKAANLLIEEGKERTSCTVDRMTSPALLMGSNGLQTFNIGIMYPIRCFAKLNDPKLPTCSFYKNV